MSTALKQTNYLKPSAATDKRRVSIFVDVQNVYYTTKSTYQRNFNYQTFWEQVTSGRELICANAYATDRGDKRQIQFQNILRDIGFNVRLKPYIQRKDGSAKGDWDVGITLDAVEMSAKSDVLVLVSGDGDFESLLKHVQIKHGIETEVYGVPKLTAQSLMQASSRFIPIEDELLM